MLESIRISNVSTFQKGEQVLDGLSKLNFVFGSNGVGKTTISRIIADEDSYPSCAVKWRAGLRLRPLIYNRDFVDRNFNQSAEFKGVFTLGEENVETLEKIARFKKELDDLIKKIGNLNLQSNKQEIELNELEKKLREKCWSQKIKHDEKLQGAFEGYRSNAVKFKEKILQEWISNTSDLVALDELERKAETVLGKIPTKEQVISPIDFACLEEHESNDVLKKRVVGKSDVDIARMIEKLNNSDWVRSGRAYFETNDKTCPFCQQSTSGAFAQGLNEYFDETFEADSNAIIGLIENYKSDSERLQRQIVSIINSSTMYLDLEKIKLEAELLDSKIKINIQHLSDKKKEPSRIIELESIKSVAASIGEIIDDARSKISEHNRLTENFANEKRTLISQAWKYIIEEIRIDLEEYTNACSKMDKAIQSINEELTKADKLNEEKKAAIQELEKKTTSVQPTLDSINKLLLQFGFHSFSLKKTNEGLSYKLVRLDGSYANETLSDGERTFVTFLYFYHLLKGSNSSDSITDDRIVVIDDPVSSLDSDVLFIVSSLIKRIFNEIRDGYGHIKQIFILTHNVYFHKEVTFDARRQSVARSDETFWLIRKSGLDSKIDKHDENPVNTSYELLWMEIKRSEISSQSIQNTLRRILEHYFKILGGMDYDKICELFDGNDKFVCKSLFSWVHAGSHGVLDDLHISNNNNTAETYLRVFREIFKASGHDGHYKMMMGGEFLAEEDGEGSTPDPVDDVKAA